MRLTEYLPLIASLVFIVIFLFIKNKISNSTFKYDLLMSGLLFFIIYFILISISAINGIYIQYVYDSFDINQNGFIENIEKTEGFEQAMQDVTRDTVRNFAFITGAIFSFVISLVYFLSRIILKKILNSK